MNYNHITKRMRNEEDYYDALEWVRTEANTFAESWIDEHGTKPTLEQFLDQFPQYDFEEFYLAIDKEIIMIASLRRVVNLSGHYSS